MSVSLTKGGNISLSKEADEKRHRLQRVAVACGWDPAKVIIGHKYDCDLSATLRGADGKAPSHDDPQDPGYQSCFVWANHRQDPERAVTFTGDNRTGHDTDGNKDDEVMLVDLDRVSPSIKSILFEVVIWRAQKRNQTFGKIRNCFIRIFIIDQYGNEVEELARFDIPEEFSEETLVVFGELYRHNDEWKFRAIGQGYSPEKFREETGVRHTFETDYARFSN